MSKSLIIVESPTKARTIEKFLKKELYDVRASFGHIRDLPNNASEIPLHLKKEKWSRLGINVESNFEPIYIIPDDKKKHVKELKDCVKDATEVYLATDEDREGESISWHLFEVLKPKCSVKRLVFHEITKSAIEHSLKTPREIDYNLVKAQETRRIVDRLFGYIVSPLLWKKMAPRLSAGRVQSVATRLLVERERERINFRSAEFWDIKGIFQKDGNEIKIEAELSSLDGKRIAQGKDFNPTDGKLLAKENLFLLNQASAEKLRDALINKDAHVISVEEKEFTTKPSPPFTTSTLQQEANRKLSFSAKRTMQVAQTLYENGFITYMRTDSTNLSEEALTAARDLIQKEYGSDYLPSSPRIYKTKVKNAQEAHEAIRPAGSAFAHFSVVKDKMGLDASRLYEMIWKKTIASQMTDAKGTRVQVQIGVDTAIFKASGKTISFPGYLRAYVEGSDDPLADLADQEKNLPPLRKDDKLKTLSLNALEHNTQSPARYTEGSLIKELERLGIGRPSTWATIVDVVLSRAYAVKKGTALVPSFLAMAVTGLMERYFAKVIDYEFTAKLEEDLDSISRGEEDNIKYLANFYFGDKPGLEPLVKSGEETIDPKDVCGLKIGETASGKTIEVRIGKFGPFLSDGENRSSLPNLSPDELNVEVAEKILIEASKGPKSLGVHPESGVNIYVKSGRFGPYIQAGDLVKDGDKPKLASLLAGMIPEEIDLETALKILSLPKNLGANPLNNEPIIVSNGKFGPYIKSGSDNRSLTPDLSPITITLDQAIELLKQPKTSNKTGRILPSKPAELKKLGVNPDTQAEIVIKNGRYGMYVTDGSVNASIPKDFTVDTFTLADAISILSQKTPKPKATPKKAKAEKKPATKVAVKELKKKPVAKESKGKKASPKTKTLTKTKVTNTEKYA